MISRAITALSLVVPLLALVAKPACAGPSADPSARLPDREVLACALAAYHGAEQAGLVRNQLLTVIDYGLPSSLRRLWVIEPRTMRVLMHEFVAHGRGSAPVEDPDRAIRFGNEPESHRSSLGTFLTGDTYAGEHGYSLELFGLEPGVNDRAQERHIVMHPAAYVGEAFRAKSGGRVGRSWGCPALDPAVAHSIIERIQDGSVVFAAGPNRRDDRPHLPFFSRAGEHAAGLPALSGDQGG
ncbi:MAG TPA: murein L,D-transpeptidase catalytic domain family protein [Myxococcota bacterium]|nr:murein L,D-transpeptidase catalytic domain family protein [Myxococcota bacterium]